MKILDDNKVEIETGTEIEITVSNMASGYVLQIEATENTTVSVYFAPPTKEYDTIAFHVEDLPPGRKTILIPALFKQLKLVSTAPITVNATYI